MSWWWLDLRSRFRERSTWLAAAMFLYALAAIPVLLASPPPHVTAALRAWFGADDPFRLFLYLWIDVAMNKLAVLLAVVVAGQTLVREATDGSLVLFAARPVRLRDLFLVRATTAVVLVVGLYAATVLAALVVLPARVPGFEAGTFLMASVLHAGAVAFAVLLAATIAVTVRRPAVGSVVSLLVLFTLVGASFLGFYQPAWAGPALLNPFAMGVQGVGHAQDLTAGRVIAVLAALGAVNVTVLWAGARAVARWEGV